MDRKFLQAERNYLNPDTLKSKAWGECESCGNEIFYGEEYCNIEGAIICESCIKEAMTIAGE